MPTAPAVKRFISRAQTDPRAISAAADANAHHQEWIAACKGGPAGYSNFDIAAYLTEIMLLGCVAMRVGEKLNGTGRKCWPKTRPKPPNSSTRPSAKDGKL